MYVTGRTASCADAAGGPGRCVAVVLDSAVDRDVEAFFARVGREEGRIDVLVNNAYSAVGLWRREQLLGKPFWQSGMGLFDAVHSVGVRAHYLATVLAVPLLRQSARRALIVNTNSGGCLFYIFNVPYGMGKCAVDKMTAGMATELYDEGIDVVSWWAKEPMQTAEVSAGGLEGTAHRRGAAPLLGTFVDFQGLVGTALAGTLLFEGRVLSALARDPQRRALSGLAVQTGQLAQHYGVVDERGVRSPQALSCKFLACALSGTLRRFAAIPDGAAATAAQRFVFGTLPDGHVPLWLVKLLAGNPLTAQWFV